MNFKTKNFNAGNTPKAIKKIGDFALVASFMGIIIGGILTAIPVTAPIGLIVLAASGGIGTSVKLASKLFGA